VATYISLIKYTDMGVANVKDSPKRLDMARERLGAIGVDIKDVYLTMGSYDLVAIIEAPDNETVARALLTLGSQGSVSTTTLAAFDEDSFRRIVASL
jgi:uncharacterized protein with GYD domain